MLADAEPIGSIAVSHFGRARDVCEGVLGLTVVSQDEFAMVLKAGPS